jgi:hypothetical protein
MASWFVAQTRIEWPSQYSADPQVQELLEIEELPVLSVANVREFVARRLALAGNDAGAGTRTGSAALVEPCALSQKSSQKATWSAAKLLKRT